MTEQTRPYAEDMDGWQVKDTLGFERRKAKIEELLRRRGATDVYALWSDSQQRLVVQFYWQGETFSMTYRPLPLRPSRRQIPQTAVEQTFRQMAYIAEQHVKVLLNLGLSGLHPEILLPYSRALTHGGPTLQEIGVEKFKTMLEDAADGRLALTSGTPEFEEVKP